MAELLATGQTLRAEDQPSMKPSALRIERLLVKVEVELARNARPRRYCFYFDEEAEAKARVRRGDSHLAAGSGPRWRATSLFPTKQRRSKTPPGGVDRRGSGARPSGSIQVVGWRKRRAGRRPGPEPEARASMKMTAEDWRG